MSSNEPNQTNSGSTWQGPLRSVNGTPPTQRPFNTAPPISSAPFTSPQQPVHAPSAGQSTPMDQPWASEPLELFPSQHTAEDANTHLIENQNTPDNDDFELAGPTEAPVSRLEILAQIGQYVSLVLAPLLFGGLTCLFVLPLVANGRAKIPPEGLWPLAAVIIIIAVGQGVAVYYSGSNNVLWAISTLGAFFLFLLVGCFAIFGVVSGIFLLALFVILTLILARLYVRHVPQGTVEMTYLFGKYNRTLYQGFNILLPWEKVQKKGIKVIEQDWASPLLRVQMSRTEDIEISASISYQLIPEDAHIALTEVGDWEARLRETFNATIKNVATMLSPDDLLAWQRGLRSRFSTADTMNRSLDNTPRWEQINNYLLNYMRDKAALLGVQVNSVHVRDAKLMPHDAATLESVSSDSRPSNTATTQPDNIRLAKQGAPSPAQPAAPAVTLPNVSNEALEAALTKSYREVQNGSITDPNTIRRLAQQFEAVARDPEKNKHVNFDAARAARNLYEEAEQYEIEVNHMYNDETKTDWNLRQPSDDNTRLGG